MVEVDHCIPGEGLGRKEKEEEEEDGEEGEENQ